MYIIEKIKSRLRQFIVNIIAQEQKKNIISCSNEIPETATIQESKIFGDVLIGERSLVYKCELNGSIKVGSNTSLNGPNTDIFSHVNKVLIGNFCSIARNVSIQEYNHRFDTATSYFIKSRVFEENWKNNIVSNGDICIGNDVWIGTQCVVLSGATIGNGAVIAANSIVSKSIPPYAIAAGSPAKVIGYRFSEEIINKLNEIKWWDWSIDRIKRNYDFFDGKLTLEKFDNIQQ